MQVVLVNGRSFTQSSFDQPSSYQENCSNDSTRGKNKLLLPKLSLKRYSVSKIIQTRNYSNFICQSCNSNLEAFALFRNNIIDKQRKLGFYLCRIKDELTEAKTVAIEIKEEPTFSPEQVKEIATEFIFEETVAFKNEILSENDWESPLGWESEDDPADEPFSTIVEAVAEKPVQPIAQSVELPIIKKGSLFHCGICDRKFKERRYVKSHLAGKHSIGTLIESKLRGLERIACDTCGKLVRRHSMKSHNLNLHQKAIRAECDICGMKFTDKQRVKSHLKVHIPVEHRKEHFECDICQRTFTTLASLRTHKLKTHINSADSFICHCGKTFKHQDNLRQHVRYIHREAAEKRNCKYCGKEFRLSTVKHHEAMVHEKEFKYICKHEGCDKKFFMNSRLTKHVQKKHTNLRPFVCSYPDCTEAFVDKGELDLHIGLEHLKLRETCPVVGCKFSVGRKLYMITHLKRHAKLSPEEVYHYRSIINKMKLA